MIRVLGNVIAFLSIYFLPWWLFLIVLVIFVSFFNKFYESIIYALIFDLLYRSGNGLDISGFKITIVVILAVLLIQWSKKYLKFFPER